MTDLDKIIISDLINDDDSTLFKFLELNRIKINLKTYNKYYEHIIYLNGIARGQKDIHALDESYLKEEFLANKLYRFMYNAIKENEKLNELPKKCFDDLKKNYLDFKSISNIGEDEYEKAK